MLPPELEVAKELIDKLLITKPQQRVSNIEYLEINENMLVDALLLRINLKSNDVYSTEMTFDVYEY